MRYTRRHIRPNITPLQDTLLRQCRSDYREDYTTINADKNLGQCYVKTEHLTERGVSEHLGNQEVYQRLTETAAHSFQRGFEMIFDGFITKCQNAKISKAEITYLVRGRNQRKGKLARFYMTAKMHKTVQI